MTETNINALFDTINELKQKNTELERENQILKLKYENECLLNENKRLKCGEVLDSFIRGKEDEKGISPNNNEYQERMDFTLKLLRRLEEELNKVMGND
ncbi:hypothetical protein [uncultured Methanobrevibacter sp.]|uniref:hypothetical protein n=1 Tax=uncultured Methanobrevibacter sp. TaxID=253161 RepID=UPI0025F67B62|nr:hypothetical protein [uncultured Methanobrevibacter sp.]